MANRPNIKSWTASTNDELLVIHDELVKKLQDPAYAGIDPSTVKSGSPVHTLDRGTLSSLEAELEKRGATYTPSQGRIIPAPGAPVVTAPDQVRQTLEARNVNLKTASELLRDQPKQKQALADILAELSSVHNASAVEYGYNSRQINTTEMGRNLYDQTVDAIHADVAKGIDPHEALRKNVHLYNLPSNVEQTTLKRIDTLLALPEDFGGSYDMPEQALFNRDEFEARYKGQPLDKPSKPIGRPVISAGQNPPPQLLDVDPNARIISSSGNIIDDIITASDDPNFGKAFRDILDKSDFLNREFNFPGANKAVTGAEILGHIKGVGFSEMVPGVAAFEPTSGNIFFNPKVISAQNDLMAEIFGEAGVAKSAEASVFTTVHEIGHAGANLAGIDDPQKAASANRLMGQMPDEIAAYIGQQEGIADSFAQEVRSQAGMPRYSGSSYDKLIDQVTGAQEMGLGRKLTLDEVNEFKTILGGAGVQNVDVRAGLLGYLGVNAADQESLLKNVNSPKLQLMSSAYDEIGTLTSQVFGTQASLPIVSQPSKPIGRPVISTGQKPPPPTKAGSQQTAARVTQSGNATPKPQAAVVATPKPTSTGAPLPATSPVSRSLTNNMSQAVTKGIKGSGSLKMLGAAALVGLGASTISRRRTQQENIDRRLEMQRRGIIT